MTLRIACLHTHPDNVRFFEDACPDGMSLIHHVRSDLLARATNGADEGLLSETRFLLAKLARNAEGVLLTCSSLREATGNGYYSADALLASELEGRATGKRVEALYTNPGSTAPTTGLFSTLKAPSETRVTLIEDAWNHFQNGDRAEYYHLVARAADESEADIVVFAQSSMSPAENLCGRSVMSLPGVALEALAGELIPG
jgi:hypothetical protein